jgi:hypothetical protein
MRRPTRVLLFSNETRTQAARFHIEIPFLYPHPLSRIHTSHSVYIVYSKSKNTNKINKKMVEAAGIE